MPSSREILRTATLVVAVVAGFALVATIAKMLLLLFAGFLLAIALHGTARALSKVTRLPHVACVALIVLACIAGTAGCVLAFGPKLAERLRDMGHDLPGALAAARTKLHLPASSGGAMDMKTFLATGKQAAHVGVETLSAIVVMLVVAIFGAAQPDVYRRAVLSIVPRDRERAAGKVMDAVTHDLRKWLFGRAIAMVFMGTSAWLAFVVLKVPMAGLLGILAGLFAFVEYIGAIVSAIPPVLLALSQGPGHALAVVGVFTVLHVIEGYVLTPLLARATVHVPPAAVIAGQVIAGALLGPVGLTFSTPLIVVAMSTVLALRRVRDEDSLVGRSVRAVERERSRSYA